MSRKTAKARSPLSRSSWYKAIPQSKRSRPISVSRPLCHSFSALILRVDGWVAISLSVVHTPLFYPKTVTTSITSKEEDNNNNRLPILNEYGEQRPFFFFLAEINGTNPNPASLVGYLGRGVSLLLLSACVSTLASLVPRGATGSSVKAHRSTLRSWASTDVMGRSHLGKLAAQAYSRQLDTNKRRTPRSRRPPERRQGLGLGSVCFGEDNFCLP